uniref:Putative secreted protein n=1 Tax=Ixodes ricinus TaxID=34613 RepID=A0A090XCY4_IXORI
MVFLLLIFQVLNSTSSRNLDPCLWFATCLQTSSPSLWMCPRCAFCYHSIVHITVIASKFRMTNSDETATPFVPNCTMGMNLSH